MYFGFMISIIWKYENIDEVIIIECIICFLLYYFYSMFVFRFFRDVLMDWLILIDFG